ncbi:hypothetical protein A2a_b_00018 [Klebsiella phage VLCpiA2a]|nr:hypothetical protein A2a_b_00018 [Klebsiella phage VLCpiA2a]
MTKLTKAEVIEHCREVFRENPETFRGDAVAKREYFSDYTDMLCKDEAITTHQYNTWSNPF